MTDHLDDILSQSIQVLERLTIRTTSLFEKPNEGPTESMKEAEFAEQCAWKDAELWAISRTNDELFNEVMATIDNLTVEERKRLVDTSTLIDPGHCIIDRLYIDVDVADDFVNIVQIDVPRMKHDDAHHDSCDISDQCSEKKKRRRDNSKKTTCTNCAHRCGG